MSRTEYSQHLLQSQLQHGEGLIGFINQPSRDPTAKDRQMMGTRSTGDGEIVQVQGRRIVRFTGRKDRHSKVYTAKGPRDRRIRLSAQTAMQFYDVQDRLGYDRPSKAVDWLIKKAKSAIDKLAELPPCHPVDGLEAERNALGCNEMALAAEHSESTGYNFLLHRQLADNPSRDYMKSFFPASSTTSSMNLQSYPSKIIPRTTSNNHAEDLGLSLHSFQDHQGLIHGESQADDTRPRPSNDCTMFAAASTPIGFESNFQRMVAWTGKTDIENSVADRGGFTFIPPSLPLHQHALLMSQGPAFTQRGPLQSSSAPSIRARSDLPMAASTALHGTNEIHQS